ncbi:MULTISPECIES: hypothetical protein [Cyanophyceae]|uniref:hypothetical protein n=1 Tax=Cyanophyceae TaxID=3028117 RepID=UPI0016826F11|nr:hypothetical protein [Trichocoleus sp. FACHB-40]MBD2006948.1 hypothetical protein [Trichocoleus sp. FACHB-40]
MYYLERASRDVEVIRVNNQGRLQVVASAANLDVRVLAWDMPCSQATILTTLIAAAERMCCNWGVA